MLEGLLLTAALHAAALHDARPAPAGTIWKFAFATLDVRPEELRAELPAGCILPAELPSTGRLECALPDSVLHAARAQVLWNDGKVEIARFLFGTASGPAHEVVKDLIRVWGNPSREITLLREHRWLVEWDDAEHRATLESEGPRHEERPVVVTLERKPPQPTAEFTTLRLHPFAPFRLKGLRRVEYDGVLHASVWGTSLTAAEEATGTAASGTTERGYAAIYRYDRATHRWHALWELTLGEEDEPTRLLGVEVSDVSGDGNLDLVLRLACHDCGAAASEIYVKTVRAGRVVDLLAKHDLYRATVQLSHGEIRINEPGSSGDAAGTTAVYAYDKAKGTFVLMREESNAEDD